MPLDIKHLGGLVPFNYRSSAFFGSSRRRFRLFTTRAEREIESMQYVLVAVLVLAGLKVAWALSDWCVAHFCNPSGEGKDAQ